MEGSNILEIVLKARDEASKTIKEMSGTLDDASKRAQNLSTAFKEAGAVMLGAGLAGVAVMKTWIDSAVDAQTTTIKTNTLLASEASAMSTASTAIYEHTGTVKENVKAIQEQIQANNLKIESLRLSTGNHKDEIKAIQQANLSLRENELQIRSTGIAHGEVTGYIKGTAVSIVDLQKATAQASEKMLDLGFNSQLAGLDFATLLGATKDVTQANTALTVAADLARFKNISLEDATTSVTRAYEGNTKALKALGIELPTGAKGMEVISALQGRLSGQAENFANSYAGLNARLSASFEDLKVRLGERLLPMFDSFANKIEQAIKWFNSLSPAIIQIIARVTLFGTAFALVAGPILLIIGFLPALSAGFAMISGAILPLTLILAGVALSGYMIYTHWNEITKAFQASQPFINGVIASLMQFWKQIQPQLILVFNLISSFILQVTGAIVSFVQTNQDTFIAFWEVVKGVFNFSIGFITGLFQTVWPALSALLFAAWEVMKGIVQAGWGFIQILLNVGMLVFTGDWNKAWEGIKKGLQNVWDGIVSIVKGSLEIMMNAVRVVIQGIAGVVNGIISGINAVTSKLPSGSAVQIPLIPKFEMGGYVPSTGLAVVHEGEYVLSKDMLAGKQAVNLPSGGNVSKYNQPINIYATVNENMDMNLLGHKIAFALRNSR